MKLRATLLVAAISIGATGALAAQSQQAAPSNSGASSAAKTLDPNEVVCEKQEVIGSRLASKRICMTRSQWADQKGQDRQEVEKVQTQRGDPVPR
jgi:invasion protein IalB